MLYKRWNILIIEDSKDDLELYSRLLNKIFKDCIIDHCCLLDHAIKAIKSTQYNLILLDYNLPDMTGLDLIRAIKLAGIDLLCPIVALTGQGNEDVAVEFMRLGASDYIPKDKISLESLSNSINKSFNAFRTKQIEREKQEELYRFVHTIAHDLKGPLGRIGAYANLLAKRPENIGSKYVQNIQEDSIYMVEFIDNLLLYAESGRSSAEKTEVDLNLVVEKSLKNLELEIASRDAVIKADSLPIVLGDKISLVQLFQNLISNSIKYCEQRPWIEISSEFKTNHMIVSLADNGIGIAKDKIKDVFKPFTRIANDLGKSGLGLGLALCETIANQHGAIIDLIPRKDGGTKANIVFAKI
jgi:signal transduction histidine kinase